MLIKDIKRFCDTISLLNESMSIKDFRSEIQDRWGIGGDIKTALQYFKSNPSLKKEISLNDFLATPWALSPVIAKYYKEKVEREELYKSYAVVKETEEWILVCPFTIEASYYLAHKFLRQKGDEEKFDSGPSWCIAKENDTKYWNDYTKNKNYPVVYYIISKTNSRDRYAVVFNNLHQEQSQKDKDIEFSKENMEKGYSISHMNGEVRDFAQRLPRKDVISLIEQKFNINLNLSIKSRNKSQVNLTKIVYDNFDKTLESSKNSLSIPEKEKGIYELMNAYWKTNRRSTAERAEYFFEFSKKLKTEFGLDYKKDFHPKTFDLIMKCVVSYYKSNNLGYDTEPLTTIIKTTDDIDAFYSMFLIYPLLLSYRYLHDDILRNNIIAAMGDKNTRKKYFKRFKKDVEEKKYPKLLNLATKSFSEGVGKEIYNNILMRSANKVYGIPEETLELFYLVYPPFKKVSKGFNKLEMENILATLSENKILNHFCEKMRLDDDSSRKNFIFKYYGIGENGIIYKLKSSEETIFDFLFDGANIKDFYSENFVEVTIDENNEKILMRGLKDAHKFLKKHTGCAFGVGNYELMKKFVDFCHAKERGLIYGDGTESVQDLSYAAMMELIRIFNERGYLHKSFLTLDGKDIFFFYPKPKEKIS